MTRTLQSCPICWNDEHHGFVDNEYVDIGVGSVPCSPAYCTTCGFYEVWDQDKAQVSYFQLEKLWEHQFFCVDVWGSHQAFAAAGFGDHSLRRVRRTS